MLLTRETTAASKQRHWRLLIANSHFERLPPIVATTMTLATTNSYFGTLPNSSDHNKQHCGLLLGLNQPSTRKYVVARGLGSAVITC